MTALVLEPFAAKQSWRIPGEDLAWDRFLSQYLEAIAQRCAACEPYLIGHIKALALFPNRSYLQVSVVSPTIPATIKGQPQVGIHELTIQLNVLVYGLKLAQIQCLTREAAHDLAKRWEGEVVEIYSQTEPSHPYEHQHNFEGENR